MNSLIELLNFSGERFLSFAWPMLWQSSVLIAVLFVLDFAIRRRVRATVRYALWMLVLFKLVLPTSLSLPTSPGYWVQAPAVLDAALAIEIPHEPPRLAPEPASIVESNPGLPTSAPVQERAESSLQPVATVAAYSPASAPLLRWPTFIGLSWLFGAMSLLLLVVLRGRLAWRLVADASDAPDEVQSLVGECARQLGALSRIAAKVTDALATPVVCGLFRPVILLPKSLTGRLAPEQLQAVLLHELAHVRRGDLWVSHLQTALQILHFYNPLLWLANARIRRVREEAVDEMVLVALADDAEVYPETLLNVAKLSRQSPRLAFGLIGILESKRSLGARIRLMLLRPWPKSAQLGVKGTVALLVLGAMLLPMSCAKDRSATPAVLGPTTPPQVSFEGPTPTAISPTMAPQVSFEVKFVELPTVDAEALQEKLSATNNSSGLWRTVLATSQAETLMKALLSAPGTEIVSAPRITTLSGRQVHIEVTNAHTIKFLAGGADAGSSNTSSRSNEVHVPQSPVLEVTPVVSADGHSVQMTILPTITEFLGYDDPGSFIIQAQSVGGIGGASQPLTAILPLPRLRVRQLVTSAVVWDGQTVLVGGLVSQKSPERKKSLLIFITPTIVDSAGNPVHSDADMPFRKNSTPPQKLSESPQVSELPERKAHIEGTGTELNKIERAISPERTKGAENTVPAQALPVPNPWANTNLGFTSKGRQNINNKLNLIRLEEVKYDKLPLGEVVRLLHIESLRRDPEKKGINFMIAPHADTAVQRTQPNLQNLLNGGVGDPGAGGPGGNPGAFQGGAFPPVQLGPDGLPIAQPAPAAAEAVDLGSVIIQLELSHVSLAEVLDAIVKVADQPIKFTVEDYAVYFTLRRNQSKPLFTRFFRVDTNTFDRVLEKSAGGGFGNGSFGASSGSRSATNGQPVSAKAREFFTTLGLDLMFPKAVFFNDSSGMLMVHATLEELSSVEKALQELNKSERSGSLEQTTSEPIAVPGAISAPVNTNLVGLSPARQALLRKLDTIRLDEVHFQRTPLSNVVRELVVQSKQRDPDKEGISFLITQPIGGTLVSLNYRNVRLATVLNAIVKGAQEPIGYSVEDYAVVFSPLVITPVPPRPPLYTRFFKVDPNSFHKGSAGLGSTNLGFFINGPVGGFGSSSIPDAGRVSAMAREFFAALGLDITFPKAVFFNERSGLLMVHATMADLLIIEDALHVLNTPPPQLKIEAKFVEVQGEPDWGVTLTNVTANLQEIRTALSQAMPPQSETNSTSSVANLAGILTRPQFRAALQAVEKKDGTDIVSAPTVTTLSDRRARIEVTDVKTILKSVNAKALGLPGVISTNGVAPIFDTEEVHFGPVLDANVSVADDGMTMEVTALANVNEWLGYDESAKEELVQVYVDGKAQMVKPPHPQIRSRTLATKLQLRDGQTLVLGGVPSTNLVTLKHKVPVLGDLPMLGRLFRSQSTNQQSRTLYLLITPTIIDPAGNPIHSDADQPARTNSIPAQSIAAPR